jgi:hypothetical protein
MAQQTSTSTHLCGIVIMLVFLSGAAILLTAPVSADPAGSMDKKAAVTISADGDKSYYLGEKVVFRGDNYDSDTTYLFMTGPATFMDGPGIPGNGGNLSSPQQEVVSGNPGSFTVVQTKPDHTWEYSWYTSGVMLDAGTYSMYAVSLPNAKDQAGPAAADVGIIVKKPFITAEIAPASFGKGEPFTINGTAEGDPPAVQLWILGNNSVFTATAPVNPDASFAFTGDPQLSGKLMEGRYYLVVQHSMQNNRFDIAVSGDFVRSLHLNNGTNIFRISGPGSLQGSDAADALVAALSDGDTGDDTYTVIPFLVHDTGIPAPPAELVTTTPVQSPAMPAPVPFALIGATVLVMGIIMWSRR